MSTDTNPPPPTTSSSDVKASSSSSSNSNITNKPEESVLRGQLYAFQKKISKRQPLDPSYKFLIMQNSNVKAPVIHRDKMYKNFGADLREQVETYMNKYGTETPAQDGRKYKIGRYREDFDEEKMRTAFTLRECKTYEQDLFIKAELTASKSRRLNGWLIEEGERKRTVEAMALGLQEQERKKKRRERDGKLLSAIQQKMLQAEKASLEKKKMMATDDNEAAIIEEKLKQKERERLEAKKKQSEAEERQRLIEQARERERERERERLEAEEEERRRIERNRDDAMRRARRMETPQQALHRIYEPVFDALWDMEFFDGTNPFRIVIDKDNCAAMGIPDYCQVIKKPMNLTYVREKVTEFKYETLQDFFQDIELIISNALLYNSDPENLYHIAANEMKKKYIKLRKKVLLQLQSQS